METQQLAEVAEVAAGSPAWLAKHVQLGTQLDLAKHLIRSLMMAGLALMMAGLAVEVVATVEVVVVAAFAMKLVASLVVESKVAWGASDVYAERRLIALQRHQAPAKLATALQVFAKLATALQAFSTSRGVSSLREQYRGRHHSAYNAHASSMEVCSLTLVARSRRQCRSAHSSHQKQGETAVSGLASR